MAKKINVATVKIWDKAVGAVAWDDIGFANFEYEKNFVKSKLEIAPLQMPLVENKIYNFPSLNKATYRGLPGLLADSLPDAFGNKIIDAWLAREGRSKDDFSSIERLCYTGHRGMGALEFEPIILKKKKVESVPIEISAMVKLANDILSSREKLNVELREDEKKNKDALEEIINVGTSAGGARPKAIIAYNPDNGEVRSGQLSAPEGFEYWLLKFDGVSKKSLGLNDPLGFGKIEYTYYLMAKKAGIIISDCKLFKENGRAHFMTKRFDRLNGEKVHMQTLCAIAHFDYNDPGTYSYEQAFQIIRKLSLSHQHSIQLFRRMVFNVIARNQDDHTKNISFLMRQTGEWELSPAYDVTFSHDLKNKWLMAHQMTLGGKQDDFKMDDFEKIAKAENIKNWKEIVEEIKEAVSLWRQLAKSNEVEQSKIDEIRKLHRLDIKR